MRKFPLSVAFSLLLTACTAGRDYVAPTANMESRFVSAGSTSMQNVAFAKWWTDLQDPLLNSLLERGSVQNIDIQAALERIRAAEAALGRTGPNAQTSGSALFDGVERKDDPNTTDPSRGQINAQYVFDFAGGFRRESEQALANFDAAQADAGTVRLAFFADIINAYIQARYFQQVAWITRQTISSREQTLEIVNQRRELEEATELEVLRAESDVATARAQLPVLNANFETNVFRLATLLAEPAGPLMQKMQRGAAQPRPRARSMVGIPADLLRNRPDVRFAERNLAAATAAIGVAEAQLYPSVVLSGSLGTASANRWSFGPTVTLPIFNRGVLQANKRVAASEARQAELEWRQTVLLAVEEVQTYLTLSRNWQTQLGFQTTAADASANVEELSRKSYEVGSITLTDVLDAERRNAANRVEVANALRNYTENWMRLQVAVGKGWLAEGVVTTDETRSALASVDPLGVSTTQTADKE
ncbi:MAG: efflux transporter outer membrane subunit [Marivita sp.]|uniref:efflux transporter outer membrane subunit n=1 Tax=Marivita sp. TaxID=2003365 RepID=UPI003EF13900